MKQIVAIIRPSKLDEVKAALTEVGIQGMTVSEVKGFGRTGGKPQVFRGSAYAVDFVPKISIKIIATDAMVTTITDAIAHTAKTAKIGDGKIFVTDIIDVIRIRTDEHGEEAI